MIDPGIDSAGVSAWCATYPEFADHLLEAIDYSASKPDIALFRLRQVLERIVKRAYTHFMEQPLPDKSSVSDLLIDSDFKHSIPDPIRNAMHAVRDSGNRAVHDEPVTANDATRALQSMDRILQWVSTWSPGGHARSVSYAAGTSRSLRGRSSTTTPLVGGVAIALTVIGLVWLYLSQLDGMLNQQQKEWVQRSKETPPSPQQPDGHRFDATSAGSGVYVRNYPSSWPAPFFQEEVKAGGWGTWLEEPNWRQQAAEQDFIWYRAVEAGGAEEAAEWAIQCRDGGGIIRDVSPGHNESCERSRHVRIRNDWHQTALVYYFAKRPRAGSTPMQ